MNTSGQLPRSTEDYLRYGANKGERNKALMEATCQFRDARLSPEEATQALLPRARADGLTEHEALSTIQSVFKRPPREPCGGPFTRGGPMYDGIQEKPRVTYRKQTIQPEPLPSPMQDSVIRFLQAKFNPGEFVSIGEGYEKRNGDISIPIGPGKARSRDTWIGDIKQQGLDAVWPSTEGLFVRVNPMSNSNGTSDKDVAAYRDLLVESDEGNREDQLGAILAIGLPISAIVFSGDRSVQAHVRVDAPDAATYRDRFRVVHQYCVESLGLKMDEKNINPSRYSRLPGGRRTRRDRDTKEKILDDKGRVIIDTQDLLRINLEGKPWEEWVKTLPVDDGLPEIKSLAQIIKENLPEPPQIISSILHQGLKLLLAAPSKARKTWILMHLALALATGQKWLGNQCQKGPVLYINFELPEPFYKKRAQYILSQMGIKDPPDDFYELNLRGYAGAAEILLPKISQKIKRLKPLIAIVIDPTYKLMGDRDENAAADIATLMNEIDRLAVETGAAVISAAHFAKGNSSTKEAIDRPSGSGVFGRDPDSILIMSPLESEDSYALEFILRCLPPKEKIAIRLDTWCFEPDDNLDPGDLKKTGRPPKHSVEDLMSALGQEYLTSTEWQEKCMDEYGMSRERFFTLKNDALKEGRVYKSPTEKGKWTAKA